MNDPFSVRFEVPVAGGSLKVARVGPPAQEAERVIVAVHGITASHLAWRAVARELGAETGVCVLAPDLRGRGGSAALPGPYGMAAHVADLVALLDYVAAPPVVAGGHSMGAYVVARLAADHPERVSSVVLVDGGLPIPVPSDADPDELLTKSLGPAAKRLGQIFAKRDDYLAMWRQHPAFAGSWNSDVEAYVSYDLESTADAEAPDAVRSVVSADAFRADGEELLLDEEARTALHRVHAPVWLLRSPRGLLDDEKHPLIPGELFEEFAAGAGAELHVENVLDTNHYTILLGDGPGPLRVAAAFRTALGQLIP
jgi:pimeloyl-ACP methyl ester carboxylesterase